MTANVVSKEGRPNYYIRIKFKDEITGKYKEKWFNTSLSIKGNNKRKAEKEKELLLEKYRDNPRALLGKDDVTNDIDKKGTSNSDMFCVFISNWLENRKHAIAPITFHTYSLIINNQVIPFFEPKKLKVQEITPQHINEYINEKLKTVSPNTVRKHLFNISKCLDSAVLQNLILVNPVKRIEMPKKMKFTGAKYYEEEQIERLLAVSKGDVLESVLLFAVYYGLRRSEIVGLKWDAINFDKKEITIKRTSNYYGLDFHTDDRTKTKSSYRVLPMPEIVEVSLKNILERKAKAKIFQPNDYIDEGFVFTHVDEDGRILLPNFISKRFKQIIINNNMPVIRFHDLRHTAASYLFKLGYNFKEIQMWLGHGDIGTTMNIYAHLDMNDKIELSDNLSKKYDAFKRKTENNHIENNKNNCEH